MAPQLPEFTTYQLIDMGYNALRAEDKERASSYIKAAFSEALRHRDSDSTSDMNKLSAYALTKMTTDASYFKILAESGVNIDHKLEGQTLLVQAINKAQIEPLGRSFALALALLEAGADPNYYNYSEDPVKDPGLKQELIAHGAYMPGERQPTKAELERMTPNQKESYFNLKHAKGVLPSQYGREDRGLGRS